MPKYSTLLMQIYKSILHHNLLLSDFSCWFFLWKIVKTIWKHQQLTQQKLRLQGPYLSQTRPPPERMHSAMVKILEMPLLGQLWASMPWFRCRVQEMIVLKVLLEHQGSGFSGTVSQLYHMHIIAGCAEVSHLQKDNYIQTWTRAPKFSADTSE